MSSFSSRAEPWRAMQHALRIGAGLLLASTSCHAQQQQQCPADQVGSCNELVCCCSKGGLISYKPSGTDCKPVYSDSFIACVVVAIATIIITIASGWYFGGRGSMSPFPPSLSPVASRYATSGGGSYYISNGGAAHYPPNGAAHHASNGGYQFPPINGGYYPPIHAAHQPDHAAATTTLHLHDIAGARPAEITPHPQQRL